MGIGNIAICRPVGGLKEIVVQFGSRMAIQPSSCETIVGMYNIYLNNEKSAKNGASALGTNDNVRVFTWNM